MPITKNCLTCGTVFTHPPSRTQTYCSRSCRRHPPEVRQKIGREGAAHPNFKGGWVAESKGGRRMRVPVPRDERHRHPTIDRKGYLARSHLIWNQAHPDDPVLPGEIVHHRNHDSMDDRPENLEKLSSQSPHASHHFKTLVAYRKRDDKGRFVPDA